MVSPLDVVRLCQEPGITLPQTEHVTYGPITACAIALRPGVNVLLQK